MDLVSVIIPYYKKRNFVKETLDSVINQDYDNLEVLIIYDDTNLNDYEFLQQIAKLDSRIKIIKNKSKLGAGLSRNIGIENSNGKYIAFLDADDTWSVDKLKSQILFMKRNNYKISHTSYYITDEKKKIIGQRRARNLLSINDIIKSCDIGLSTVVLEKNVIVYNKVKFPNLKTKEDFVFWLMLLKKDFKFYAQDKYLTNWTDLKNSLSSSTIQKLMDAIDSEIEEPTRDVDKPLLMSVEDVFTITGRGTVATGRIERGVVKVGEEIEIVGLGESRTTTCTGVEMFRKDLDQGQAGDNVGILLRGIEKAEIQRGHVIAAPGSIKPHTRATAQIYVLNKEEGGRHTPFFKGYRPQFFFGTADVTGIVELPEDVEMVMPGDNLSVTIELQKSIAMESGQRFAIREGGKTIGAGNITDIL